MGLSHVLLPDVSSLPIDAIMDVRTRLGDSLDPMRAEMLRLTEDLRQLVGASTDSATIAAEADLHTRQYEAPSIDSQDGTVADSKNFEQVTRLPIKHPRFDQQSLWRSGYRARRAGRPSRAGGLLVNPGLIRIAGANNVALLSILRLLAVARALLAVALARQDRFESLLLARFQIESVPLNFLNDFLLQNYALEAPQRVFQSLTVLNVDLGQRSPPYSWPK